MEGEANLSPEYNPDIDDTCGNAEGASAGDTATDTPRPSKLSEGTYEGNTGDNDKRGAVPGKDAPEGHFLHLEGTAGMLYRSIAKAKGAWERYRALSAQNGNNIGDNDNEQAGNQQDTHTVANHKVQFNYILMSFKINMY
jgi:hypothetical protein